MKSGQIAAVTLLLVAPLASTPSAADAIFNFTQTGSSPAGVLKASGTLALSKATFFNGVAINRDFFFGSASNPPNLSGTGITGIDFRVVETDQVPPVSLEARLGNFVPGSMAVGPFWVVTLNSAPHGVPTGQVVFNSTVSDFTFNLGNPASSGSFNSDVGNSASCGQTGVCSFSGTWKVPEPATIGVLGLGALPVLRLRTRARLRRG